MARSRGAAMPETLAMPGATTAPDGDLAAPANLPMVTQSPALPVVEAWCSIIVECQREAAAFVTERLEKDKEAIREALAAKDLVDAATIQARWVQQTMQDYAAEMSKMLSIYTRHDTIRSATAVLH
jgi:hypothetical protein